MERADGLGGAYVPSDDPERLGRWYADHLGVYPAPRHDQDGAGLYVSTTPVTEPHAAWRLRITVPDLDAMVAQLHAAGTTIESGPAPGAGGRFAEVRDPDGNLVQLWQPMPAGPTSSEPSYVHPFGEPAEPPAERASTARRLARWVPLALVVVLGIVVVTVLRPAAEPEPSADQAPSRTTSTTSAPPTTSTAGEEPPVVVSELDDPLLGITGEWEILAAGTENLIRIEPVRGRVTHTELPDLNTGGPVSLVVGANRTLLLPMDNVPGYVVPDGEPARSLPDTLGTASRAFPGPEPGQLWLESQRGSTDDVTLRLANFNGKHLGPTIAVAGTFWPEMPDGTGHVLTGGIGGTYVARPDGLRRLTTGRVLALGPTRLLAQECDERARCTGAVIDRSTGARRNIQTDVASASARPGPVSPDGRQAAVVSAAEGQDELLLIDLDTGRSHVPDLVLAPSAQIQTQAVAWSPDSRWLFVATAQSGLTAIDTRSGDIHELEIELPHLNQVAIRPASG